MAVPTCFISRIWLFLIILSGTYDVFTVKPTKHSSALGSVVIKPVCTGQYGNTLECHVPVLDDHIDFSVYTGWVNTVIIHCDKNIFLPSRLTGYFFEILGHTLKSIFIHDCCFANVSRYAFRGINGLRHLIIRGQSNSQLCLQTPSISNSTQQPETEFGLMPNTIICNFDNLVLPDDVFAELGNLTSLKMVSTRLNSSVWHELESLGNIQYLYLSNNNITTIDINTTNKPKNLKLLDLKENAIQNILNGTFETLDMLLWLDLSSNRITFIDRGSFRGLRKLDTLDLSENSVSTIDADTFEELTQLRTLNMSENAVSAVEIYTFKGLSGISTLDLSGNSIRTVAKGTFQGLCKMNKLYLSRNSIRNVELDTFEGLSELRILDLSENNIRIVETDTFKGLSKLLRLDLSGNRIRSVEIGTFNGLTELYILDLSENSIQIVKLDTFKELRKLDALDLSENSIQIVELNTFKGLSILRRLDLSRNNINTVEIDTFKELGQLKSLELSGNSIQCVKMDTFKELSKLSVLQLSHNRIRTLVMDTFNGLSELHTLDLSSNTIRFVEMDIFKGLRSLQTLNLSGNRIRTIKMGTFHGLTKLRSLTLTENEVTTIDQHALSQLTSLQTLSLSNNRLGTLPNFPRSLISLDLRNNNVVEIDNSSFARLPHLADLDLSHNKMRKYAQINISQSIKQWNLSSNELSVVSFNLPSDLRYLDFRNNQLKSLAIDGLKEYRHLFESGDVYLAGNGNKFHCFCNLEVVHNESTFSYHSKNDVQYHIWNFTSLRCSSESKYGPGEMTKIPLQNFSCQYYMSCPDKCTCYHWRYRDEINIVNCLNASLRSVPENVSATCTILDLSGNMFESLKPGNFDTLSQLVELYLNSSNITEIKEGTFRKLSCLTKLDLRHNSVRRLDSRIFKGLNMLSFLDLSFNRINLVVESTFRFMKGLKALNIEGNKLKMISSSDIESMYTLMSLKLSNNPWSCDCTFLEKFISLTTMNNVQDQANIICITSNKTEIYLVKIHMQAFCPYKVYKEPDRVSKIDIAVLCGAGALVIGIICFGIVFKNREFFKIWFFAKCGWKSASSEADELNKQYDAFVSYSSRDEDFIIRELMPRLEQPRQGRLGYKLCVHFRDFPVGRHIPETIHNVVENSRRVIMILSDNFLSSEWCQYEYQAAHHQLLTERKSRIIMVLLHDINSDLLDRQLKMYLRTRTYVKYGDPLFWDKLEYAMPERQLPAEENLDAENIADQADSIPAVAAEESDDDAQLIN